MNLQQHIAIPLLPQATPERLRAADEALAGRLTYVGESYDLPAGIPWMRSPSRDKEWLIALHKHPFAVDLALAYRERGDPAYLRRLAELLGSWLAEVGTGALASSDAQVEALRLTHWVYAMEILRGAPGEALPDSLVAALVERAGAEARYILANLRPARNHRTFQLYSVFLAGVCLPELPDAPRLAREGAALLCANLLDDILPDGVQVELSTHYHQLVIEAAASLVALARAHGIALDPAVEGRLRRGLEFCLWAQRPDGSLPLLGDSDDGDQAPLLALGAELFDDPALRWGASLGAAGAPPAAAGRYFADSGYLVLGDGWGHGPASYAARQHLTFDCGPLGAGSHCHYDLFGLTYYAGGAPLLIDPGRYTYSAEPDADGVDWRYMFKRTAAHNTVAVDGLDQTEYRSKWLRDRRGSPRGGPKHGEPPAILDRRLRLGEQSDWADATARCAGYAPVHRRLLLYMRRSYLLIVDVLSADDARSHRYDLRFHLDPRWQGQVSLGGDHEAIAARWPGGQVWVARAQGAEGKIEAGWASTQYGVKEPAPTLRFSQSGPGRAVFCSAVAPAGPLEIVGLRLIGGPRGGPLWCRVDGREGGAAFADDLLVSPDGATQPTAIPGLRFRGRHVARRRDAGGRTIYLCAHGAETLAWEGGPAGGLSNTEDVEWSL